MFWLILILILLSSSAIIYLQIYTIKRLDKRLWVKEIYDEVTKQLFSEFPNLKPIVEHFPVAPHESVNIPLK